MTGFLSIFILDPIGKVRYNRNVHTYNNILIDLTVNIVLVVYHEFPCLLKVTSPPPLKTVYLMLYNVVLFMKLIIFSDRLSIIWHVCNLYTYFPTNFYSCMLFLKFAQRNSGI